jgi:hypothetical protein
MDIVVWLRSLGLGKYEAIFRENEIDETVLPNLTGRTSRSLASRRWGTGASCWMPSLLCAPMRAARRLPLTLRLRPVPRGLPKTAPSAAR